MGYPGSVGHLARFGSGPHRPPMTGVIFALMWTMRGRPVRRSQPLSRAGRRDQAAQLTLEPPRALCAHACAHVLDLSAPLRAAQGLAVFTPRLPYVEGRSSRAKSPALLLPCCRGPTSSPLTALCHPSKGAQGSCGATDRAILLSCARRRSYGAHPRLGSQMGRSGAPRAPTQPRRHRLAIARRHDIPCDVQAPRVLLLHLQRVQAVVEPRRHARPTSAHCEVI